MKVIVSRASGGPLGAKHKASKWEEKQAQSPEQLNKICSLGQLNSLQAIPGFSYEYIEIS